MDKNKKPKSRTHKWRKYANIQKPNNNQNPNTESKQQYKNAEAQHTSGVLEKCNNSTSKK